MSNILREEFVFFVLDVHVYDNMIKSEHICKECFGIFLSILTLHYPFSPQEVDKILAAIYFQII